jgi:hypothetical protein
MAKQRALVAPFFLVTFDLRWGNNLVQTALVNDALKAPADK